MILVDSSLNRGPRALNRAVRAAGSPTTSQPDHALFLPANLHARLFDSPISPSILATNPQPPDLKNSSYLSTHDPSLTFGIHSCLKTSKNAAKLLIFSPSRLHFSLSRPRLFLLSVLSFSLFPLSLMTRISSYALQQPPAASAALPHFILTAKTRKQHSNPQQPFSPLSQPISSSKLQYNLSLFLPLCYML